MASTPREVWGDLAATTFVETSLLFRSLDDEARRDLVQLARLVEFEPGEVISPEADDGFWLVRDGVASVRTLGPAGEVLSVCDAERGAVFGAGRAVGHPAAARWSLAARTAVSAVVFPAPMIAALAERAPKMRKLLEAVLAAREREASERAPG